MGRGEKNGEEKETEKEEEEEEGGKNKCFLPPTLPSSLGERGLIIWRLLRICLDSLS